MGLCILHGPIFFAIFTYLIVKQLITHFKEVCIMTDLQKGIDLLKNHEETIIKLKEELRENLYSYTKLDRAKIAILYTRQNYRYGEEDFDLDVRQIFNTRNTGGDRMDTKYEDKEICVDFCDSFFREFLTPLPGIMLVSEIWIDENKFSKLLADNVSINITISGFVWFIVPIIIS